MVKLAMTTMAILAGGVIAPASAAGASPPQDAGLDVLIPCTVQLSPVFHPVVRQLLAASPTFRAQMQRIAHAPRVRVSVEPAVGGVGGCCTLARTVFRHYTGGAVLARVEIAFPLTVTEYAELLGHEFEHIVEQIDRVDLPAMARSGGDARVLADGAFETRRAAQAGRAIAGEAERADIEPPDRVRQGLARAVSALGRLLGRLMPRGRSGDRTASVDTRQK
jgi:hypothetical protein